MTIHRGKLLWLSVGMAVGVRPYGARYGARGASGAVNFDYNFYGIELPSCGRDTLNPTTSVRTTSRPFPVEDVRPC